MFSPEEEVESVDISGVEPNRMRHLRVHILKAEKVIRHLRRSGHLRGPVEAEHEQVHDEAVVLDDEGGELEAADDAVAVGVVHVLVVDHHVVLGRHVVGNVVVNNQP